jgi:hypothetical protein
MTRRNRNRSSIALIAGLTSLCAAVLIGPILAVIAFICFAFAIFAWVSKPTHCDPVRCTLPPLPRPLPPLSTEAHLVYVSFPAVSFVSCVLYIGAYVYASSHDPWLTPRWTYYMILWWGVGRTILGLFLLLFPTGVLALVVWPELRKRPAVWASLFCMVFCVVLTGIP